MNVIASIPDELAFRTGEEVQFQASVQPDGTFLVTKVLHRAQTQPKPDAPMTLGQWGRKWAGAFKLPEGTSVDDLRRSALSKKHGL